MQYNYSTGWKLANYHRKSTGTNYLWLRNRAEKSTFWLLYSLRLVLGCGRWCCPPVLEIPIFKHGLLKGTMDLNTVLILVLIGITAGVLSGFVGVGGGIIIVPALVYLLGLSQFEAQGTSILLMIPPIGILAAMNYYKVDAVNWKYAGIIAATFVIGGYFGSKLTLKLDETLVKLIFGFIMLIVAIKMIVSGLAFFQGKG
ncbi:MAG: sulfite exporter TauE/SafE family protein [Flavobacteriales bacterium]|nr:sulfite exporter TauE/SafE family protein [Flavobacteriales bacterium]